MWYSVGMKYNSLFVVILLLLVAGGVVFVGLWDVGGGSDLPEVLLEEESRPLPVDDVLTMDTVYESSEGVSVDDFDWVQFSAFDRGESDPAPGMWFEYPFGYFGEPFYADADAFTVLFLMRTSADGHHSRNVGYPTIRVRYPAHGFTDDLYDKDGYVFDGDVVVGGGADGMPAKRFVRKESDGFVSVIVKMRSVKISAHRVDDAIFKRFLQSIRFAVQ